MGGAGEPRWRRSANGDVMSRVAHKGLVERLTRGVRREQRQSPESAAQVQKAFANAVPAVVVLGLNVTGLAIARALADNGVEVHGVSLSRRDPGRASRRCKVLERDDLAGNVDAIGEWLFEYASGLGARPVVFPASDELALMLARHRDRLRQVCLIWNNTYDALDAIVSKHRLYATAANAGVNVPPGLVSPKLAELESWCAHQRGPYIVKPFYVGATGSEIDFKNKVIDDAPGLLGFVRGRSSGAEGLIVQRILQGGDGWVFDCYGLTDARGQIRTMASHRRIRQYPPDFGITCYGEIPGIPDGVGEEALFALTHKLLGELRYHGIFGIEWLQDRETGALYLLDFNARPFYTIGHLNDCGMNLPMLAYRDLCGDSLSGVELTPRLKRQAWVDFWPYASTFSRLRKAGRLGWFQWGKSLLKSRSYALWRLSDPGPASRRTWHMVTMLLGKLLRRG